MSNNIQSNEELDFFNETTKFETVEENDTHTGYVFKEINSKIVKYLKSVVTDLENDNNIYFCARGDSKDANPIFIDNNLIDFFIVGEKGKAHLENSRGDISREPFRHYYTGDTILDDIRYIITKVNKVLVSKRKNGINGQIPDNFITELEQQSPQIQKGWKFIFLAFLHNKGRDDYFKPYSGFVSLTHKAKKYTEAKKWALDSSNDGLIYMYILDKNLKNYFKADKLTQKFKEYDITWYEDIHNEIMVINGLYPHYILGFFEVDAALVKRFILNPWFYSQFEEDLNLKQKYNYSNGVLINQDNFETSMQKLGYETYFIRDLSTNEEYHVNPETAKIDPVIEPL